MGEPLICEWANNRPGWLQEGMRVVVDEGAGTVTFEHCHRPRQFWAVRSDATYTCKLSEVLAVHLDWWVFYGMQEARHGRDATVSTPAGKAVFNSRMAGFQEVVAALRRHVGVNRRPWLDNPNVWHAGIVGLAVALSAAGLIWALR